MAKVIKAKAFIVPSVQVTNRLCMEMWEKFPMKCYEKRGPLKLGDKLGPSSELINLADGETSLEPLSPAAEAWVREKFPNAREVTVKWYPNA